jgi:hypothetical protein
MTPRNELIRLAKDYGFTVERTNGDHLRFSRSGCPFVIVSSTPSSRRTIWKTRAQLRRALRQGDRKELDHERDRLEQAD